MGVEPTTGIKIADRTIPGPNDFLSPEEIKKLTPRKVVENVRALKPLLKSLRRTAELQRRPTDEGWNAVRKAGYFNLMVPKELNGLGGSFDDMLDATFAICESDPAMGWNCAFTVMNSRSAAPFSEKALMEMYGDGEKLIPGKFTILNTLIAPFGQATKVEGGWRVSGTWSWATTCQNSDWVSVMAFQGENANKNVQSIELGSMGLGTFLFPMQDAVILDTWTADGLIATGTHKLMAKDVFVPDHRALPFSMGTPTWIANIRERYDYPYFRADVGNALSITIAVPLVGMARGAVQRYTELLQEWTKRGDEGKEAEKQTSQIRLAHVHAKVQAAEIQLRDLSRRTYALCEAPAKEQFDYAHQVIGEVTYVAHEARDAIMEISKGLGTSAHYVDEPMSQFIRDAVIGSTHLAVNWDGNMTKSGRQLLGLPPAAPPSKPRLA